MIKLRSVFWTRSLWLCAFLTLAFHCGGGVNADEPHSLRAGAATSNITPPLGEKIIGGWQPFPAQILHDELHARCLVLDDGKTKLAIVICDILGLPREVVDLAAKQITEATDIPATHILIAATHTHSATTARGPKGVMWQDELTDYQKFLATRIADGVRRAHNHLEPAIIGWGRCVEPSEVFNRRWEVTDPAMLKNPFGEIDEVRMNPPRGSAALVRPAGPIDPEIGFLSVRSTAGQSIALLANYSLHYVGGVPRGDVSADYFGYVCGHLEDRFRHEGDVPFVGMLTNGTSGDINNINFRDKSGARYEPYDKMKQVARKVADKIIAAADGITYSSDLKLNAAAVDLALRLRKPTAETMKYLTEVAAAQPADSRGKEKIYLERLTKLQDGPENIDTRLQVLKIGDQSICAIPFETFVEIGLELKTRSPFKQTFTIELANGWYGYLPTPAQHKRGGYETWIGTNFVQKDASEKIVAALLELSAKLK